VLPSKPPCLIQWTSFGSLRESGGTSLTAQDLTGWAQALLLDGELRVAEPKALRYRLWHVAARVVRHARRLILRLQASWPWTVELAGAFARLRALPLRC
jgi:Transposase DDE domain group 1